MARRLGQIRISYDIWLLETLVNPIWEDPTITRKLLLACEVAVPGRG